jgi:hypothetical protein
MKIPYILMEPSSHFKVKPGKKKWIKQDCQRERNLQAYVFPHVRSLWEVTQPFVRATRGGPSVVCHLVIPPF